jgi:hypothetical protein
MMMGRHRLYVTAVAVTLGAGAALADDAHAPLVRLSRPMLCVTEGRIEALSGDRLAVSAPKMRAVVMASTAQAIEARVTYLGQTTPVSRLQSGELREQFGLKLRAQDSCNLIYVMWRIAPQPGLVVSVKRNPGLASSRQCGNAGYRTVKPRRAAPLPALRPGATHRLAAALVGSELRVRIDGAPAWEGDLAPLDLSAESPVGLRSDNARLELEVFAALAAAGEPPAQRSCHEGSGGED